MLTRSRDKSGDSVQNTADVVKTPTKSKENKRVASSTAGTPSKVAKGDDLVNNILNSIGKKNADQSNDLRGEQKKPAAGEKTLLPKKKQQINIRGKPKSGRPWKEVKEKFSKIKKTIYRPTFEKKEALRHDLKHIKELSRSIKEDKKQENEQKRQQREDNFKRKLENERKSEVVQVIKNPAKLKRMKKKALRKIEKRDLATIKTV